MLVLDKAACTGARQQAVSAYAGMMVLGKAACAGARQQGATTGSKDVRGMPNGRSQRWLGWEGQVPAGHGAEQGHSRARLRVIVGSCLQTAAMEVPHTPDESRERISCERKQLWGSSPQEAGLHAGGPCMGWEGLHAGGVGWEDPRMNQAGVGIETHQPTATYPPTLG